MTKSPSTALIIRAVQRGVRWLKPFSEELTDPREVAVAITALVAVERNPHSHLIQRLAALLESRQGADGGWGEQLWDTTWAVRALCAAGYGLEHKAIRNAFRFFSATQDSMRGSWYEEPFETMLVLELFAMFAPQEVGIIGDRAIEWLCSLQAPSGVIIGVRYTGMTVSLLNMLPNRDSYRSVIEKGIEWLRRDLDTKEIWTSAAWSNYYALKALLDTGHSTDDSVVSRAINWFLSTQEPDGKWCQVGPTHDTAMAIMVLADLLTVPLIEVPAPKLGVISANRENGTLRVSFQGPVVSAMAATERMKFQENVYTKLSRHQQDLFSMAGSVRARDPHVPRPAEHPEKVIDELAGMGQYAYNNLVPPQIQLELRNSTADHIRLDVDERLISLPWERAHDGSEFLCMKYAMGRRIISEQPFRTPVQTARRSSEARALVISNPTGDLAASEEEGSGVAEILCAASGMEVMHCRQAEMTGMKFLLSVSSYDIVHYAGHALRDVQNADENALLFAGDEKVTAFEIERFLKNKAPSIVFLNACWSAQEVPRADAYQTMMRGLGRAFLYAGVTAFIGYLVPVPDDSATQLAVVFYKHLTQGQTIGEALRLARIESRKRNAIDDLTWSSVVLYGDPSARVIVPPDT